MPQTSTPSRPKPPKAAWNAKAPPGQQPRPRPTPSSRSAQTLNAPVTSSAGPFRLPLTVQNEILDHFARAFRTTLSDPSLPSRIQALKGRLYDRDFIAAFGSAENRAVYAARWSPSRALAYAELVLREKELVQAPGPLPRARPRSAGDGQEGDAGEEARGPPVVTCLGGGAGAELVGLAAAERLKRTQDATPQGEPGEPGEPARSGLELRIFDLADWRSTLDDLKEALSPEPAAGESLSGADSDLHLTFYEGDVLRPDYAALDGAVRASALVTILFTLNELYAASVGRTTALLRRLGAQARPGTLLLVVDSPGSYSTVRLGGAPGEGAREESGEGGAEEGKRRYPMQWLLDRTLLGRVDGAQDGRPEAGEGTVWEKILQDDARWFRKAGGVVYPTELEDMRYQVHLYRRR